MECIPAREDWVTCPKYHNNFVVVDDEIPEFCSQRMELLRRVVRHAKPLQAKEKVVKEGSQDDLATITVPKQRSVSLDVTSLSVPSGEERFRFDRTIGPKAHQKRVSFDAEVLLHHDDTFTLPFPRTRVMSIDSWGSEETYDSQACNDNPDSFRVLLFNKFGTSNGGEGGITDAKSVSHIYKGAALVTDLLDSKVVWFERSGKARRTFMTKESTEPWGAAMTPDGHVAVTFRRQRCVALWSSDGQSMVEFGHGHLQCPAGLGIDKSGRIFVADEQQNDVFAFNQSGKILLKLTDSGQTFKQPRYIHCSSSGRVIVADSGNHCIKVFDRNGSFLFKFGSYGRGPGQFKFPYGVCVDQHDNIIVADHYNDRVLLFSSKGDFLQPLVTSASGLRSPSGVSVRCTHNRKLYVTHGELRASEVLVFNLVPVNSELSVHVKYFV